jgi:antitoxin VapB
MGALYVKDDDARIMAEKLADRRGLTKVAAVKLALANELARDEPKQSLHDIVADLRRTSRLRIDPEIVVDKAFYDSLNDEDED